LPLHRVGERLALLGHRYVKAHDCDLPRSASSREELLYRLCVAAVLYTGMCVGKGLYPAGLVKIFFSL